MANWNFQRIFAGNFYWPHLYAIPNLFPYLHSQLGIYITNTLTATATNQAHNINCFQWISSFVKFTADWWQPLVVMARHFPKIPCPLKCNASFVKDVTHLVSCKCLCGCGRGCARYHHHYHFCRRRHHHHNVSHRIAFNARPHYLHRIGLTSVQGTQN